MLIEGGRRVNGGPEKEGHAAYADCTGMMLISQLASLNTGRMGCRTVCRTGREYGMFSLADVDVGQGKDSAQADGTWLGVSGCSSYESSDEALDVGLEK